MTSTAGRPGRSWKKILLWAIGVAVVVFLLIQLVPYGRSSHSNPPATNPFQWTDPQAEAIARESCYDCHSNETKWWWATNIAPFSWLVQRDVDGARARVQLLRMGRTTVGGGDRGGRRTGRDAAVPVHAHPPRRQADGRGEADAACRATRRASAASGGQTEATPSATPTSGSSADADVVAIINQRCSTPATRPTGRSRSAPAAPPRRRR